MLDRIFNPNPTFYKWDRFWVGFLLGLVGPLMGILFFYVMKFTGYTFTQYLQMVKYPSVLSPLLSFGAIINLFFFFPFIWNDYYNAARGVIGATFLYGIPILITKFVL
jgi:H+/Cl- antiporter ClcA